MEEKDRNFDTEDNITKKLSFVNIDNNNQEITNDEKMVNDSKIKNILKKKWIFIVLGIVLILIIGVIFCFVFYNKNDKLDSNPKDDENINPPTEVDKKVISIYKTGNNLYTFEKNDTESVYSAECINDDCFGLFVNSEYIVIKDGEYAYINNYKTDKLVIDKLKIKSVSLIKNTDLSDYGFLLKSNNDMYGIFNIEEGVVTVPFEYEQILSLTNQCKDINTSENSLIIFNDLAIVLNNKKYGVINTKKYKSIVPIENDLVCISNDYITSVNSNMQKIYSFDGKELLNGKSYDEIYSYSSKGYAIVRSNDNILLVNNDNLNIANITKYNSDELILSVGFIDNMINNKAYIVFKGSDSSCVEYYYDFDSEATIINDQFNCNSD